MTTCKSSPLSIKTSKRVERRTVECVCAHVLHWPHFVAPPAEGAPASKGEANPLMIKLAGVDEDAPRVVGALLEFPNAVDNRVIRLVGFQVRRGCCPGLAVALEVSGTSCVFQEGCSLR